MAQDHVIIISPALAKANNGNWHTAARWARLLRPSFRVSIAAHWDGQPCDALIALHARRSAASISAFAEHCPGLPLIVVLTGTDVYRDIHHDAAAQRSLQLAGSLVVLQDAAISELAPALHSKTRVIFQSAPSLVPLPEPAARRARHFDIVMAGHMRAEKDPATFMRAAAAVKHPRIRLLQVGAALEPELGTLAQACATAHPHYRWLGELSRAQTRQRIRRSALLALPSRMEGGANVIIEAVTSGVPVLASDISGNLGMLGAGYPGYFPVGDSAALAQLMVRAADDAAFYRQLREHCATRAALFAPERERAALFALLAEHDLPAMPQ